MIEIETQGGGRTVVRSPPVCFQRNLSQRWPHGVFSICIFLLSSWILLTLFCKPSVSRSANSCWKSDKDRKGDHHFVSSKYTISCHNAILIFWLGKSAILGCQLDLANVFEKRSRFCTGGSVRRPSRQKKNKETKKIIYSGGSARRPLERKKKNKQLKSNLFRREF